RHGGDGALVAFGFGQLQQFVRAAQALGEAADTVDDLVELGAFLAELLRALRVVPDIGILQLAAYFFETFLLGLVVKDTPQGMPAAKSGPQCACEWGWFRSFLGTRSGRAKRQ